MTDVDHGLPCGESVSTPTGSVGHHIPYAEWPGYILHLTDALLGISRDCVHLAINDALAKIGVLAGAQRACIVRLADDEGLCATHEWAAPGLEPVIEFLQDLPAQVIAAWVPQLKAGLAVAIPDTAMLPPDTPGLSTLQTQQIISLLVLPMLRNGRLIGMVGFGTLHDARHFLPLEIQLLKSVVTAINVVLDRGDVDAVAEQARAKLQAERDRLQAILAALPELVLEIDPDGRFVSYNSGAKLTRATLPETFLGRFPEDVLPEPLITLLRNLLQSVTDSGRPKALEYEMAVDGNMRSYMVTASPKSLSGVTGGFVLIVRDITKQRSRQSALLRLSKIAELTTNMIIVTDASGLVEWVNPAFSQRTGWTLAEVRGLSPGSFLKAPDTDPATLLKIDKAIQGGQPLQVELLNRTRSGEAYWVSKDLQPLIDAKGQIEGFVAVQTDITALKLSHQKALRDRALAMDVSMDGIAMCDAVGRYTYMNTAYRKMFGILPDDDISSFFWRDFCPPDVAATFAAQEWPRLAAEGSWRAEVAGMNRNGEVLQNEVSLTLQEDGGLLCIARDITGRLKASLEQAQLREELQLRQRQDVIAHITAGVAHDLNNFVAVVAGAVGLLESQFATNDQVLTGVARIRRATDIARNLVDGLGRLGRSEAKRAVQDLNALIVQAKDLLGSDRLDKYRIKLVQPPVGPTVFADPTELLQVIVNLALNACEAGPPGTNCVILQVSDGEAVLPQRPPDIGMLQPNLDYSLFVVSDTGCGIDADVRQRMFDRYFTTKGEAGTGLGLPIVASIVESNHGAIWFDSIRTQGTTVTVAWQANRRLPIQASRTEPCLGGDIDLTGLNILVVDDVADIADVLSEMLESAGAVSIAVSDPAEARVLLAENPGVWSALVTDLHMPKVNGVDLAELTRTLQPRVPTVLVTALPEKASHHAALFDVVLAKPTDATRLINAVKTAVANGRHAAAAY